MRGDPEGSTEVSNCFARLNEALLAAGCERHDEPVELETALRFSCDMWGYSGLHHLRRVAAYAAFRLATPSPIADGAAEDPVLKRYYAEATQPPGLISRVFRSRAGNRLPYQHLIVHSDAEGYYVPQDFLKVIFPAENLKIPGAMIGSVPRLQEECRALARLLEIPDGLDTESDAVLEAAENPAAFSARWQRYGVESFSCLRLLAACEASLKTGAAIVFC
ncbi:MAG TPA: hypothetical protein VN815_00075 [Steroidobacteraceae bacterium]|nr:hypothetical protein [Steroidobacteraceae bacterium]